ncbi:UNVERIFIED_CONTAM: hypothetical protein Sangu_3179500 [Sesamum angustifolium]|uniref:Uncharacterized protein n=1 Tax=Sesamum angustifolium TaxID=2727405 RepID=A0AAW2JNU7_9LAMI
MSLTKAGRRSMEGLYPYRRRSLNIHTDIHLVSSAMDLDSNETNEFTASPIVMINGSSQHDLLLNSQNFCHSIPAGAENSSLSRLCYRKLWGSWNSRALILLYSLSGERLSFKK